MNYIFVFVLLFNLDILAEHPSNSTLKHNTMQKLSRRRTIVSLIFSNATGIKNSAKNRTSTCRWLRGYKHQNKLCRKRRGFSDVLQEARYLAINSCQEQFRYDRWNCSYKKSVFKKVFRETAFLHAISTSAIMYSVAKACSEGKLQNCRCADQENAVYYKENWKWGGCGDNSKQAKKIVRKFLQLRQSGDSNHNILNYNSLIGLKIVAENEIKVCKCHGVSASCVMKTCWKSLHSFKHIAQQLKQSYHSAIQYSPKNTIQESIQKITKNSSKLLYVAISPNFCATTKGRECRDTENCATLCCGRGFYVTEITESKYCKCRWQKCCLNVVCETCNSTKDVFICK